MSETMLRYNEGKRQLSLLPASFITTLDFFNGPQRLINDITAVLEFGAKKYSANNWRKGGSWLKVVDSAFRHIQAYNQGETFDPESKLHHLAHVGCNLAFLLEFAVNKTDQDDRYDTKRGFGVPNPDLDWYEYLLQWRDGGHEGWLRLAIEKLAEHYETLPIKVVIDAGIITTSNLTFPEYTYYDPNGPMQ